MSSTSTTPPTRRQRMAASLRPDGRDDHLVAQATGMTVVEVVRRFWPRLRPLRWWLLLGLLLLLAAPAIATVEILLFSRLVDDVLVPADWRPLIWLAAAYLGLNVLSAVVSGADDYLGTWVSQRFLVGLRRDAFSHVLALPSHALDRRRLGDTLARLTSDIGSVERFMVGQLSAGLGALATLLFYVGALLWLQWELALASFVVVPLFWWVSKKFATLTRDISRERRRRGGSLSSLTEESLGNAALVQTYGREEQAVAAYHRQNRAIAHAELAGSRIRSVFLPLVDLAELIGILVVIGLGVWALATGRLTLGGLLAFLTLLTQCYRPIRDLSDLLPSLYSATAGVERVVELLDEPLAGDRPGATDLVVTRGEVELRGVRVAYPAADDAPAPRPVLDGLDLHLRAGEVVALVGASGSGKSTVARLLTRHLRPEAGTVVVDGQDLSDVTASSVRRAVTVVLQENLLPDATVHDAIAFARPGATRAEVVRAAHAADAHAFITRLPDGYDTRIGQRGRTLSGGQRQRLSLARALLHDGSVLVLDEPTTGLDADSSRRLLSAVLDGARDRTVLLLTHDPVALEHVDRVVRLPDPGAEPAAADTAPTSRETAGSPA